MTSRWIETDATGARWECRHKPGRVGVVERTWLEGGTDRYGYTPASLHGMELLPTVLAKLAGRTARPAAATKTAPARSNGSVRVVFTPDAHRELRALNVGEGLEVGAGLFGRHTGDEVIVCQVVPNPGGSDGASRNRVVLRGDHFRQHAENVAGLGWQWVGDMHTHNQYRASGASPSPTDERGWQDLAREYDRPWLGLILSPSVDPDSRAAAEFGDGWLHPKFSAFVVSPSGKRSTPELTIERR